MRELEKLRDDLMKMIVHDLKSPLTGVLATLEMLLDERLRPAHRRRSAVRCSTPRGRPRTCSR